MNLLERYNIKDNCPLCDRKLKPRGKGMACIGSCPTNFYNTLVEETEFYCEPAVIWAAYKAFLYKHNESEDVFVMCSVFYNFPQTKELKLKEPIYNLRNAENKIKKILLFS